MLDQIKIVGINQFTQNAIDTIRSAIEDVDGNELLPTVSLCQHCHYHVPALRYHKNNQVFIAKHCETHGTSHHMIESDYEFYRNIYYTQDNPQYNFNGGVLIEVTDRCNLACPHCYHEPDNALTDQSAEKIISQIKKWPLGEDAIHRVILSGAEPTLRKDFNSLVEQINALDPSITVSVMTNGIRFSDRNYVKSAIASGLSSVNIGLNHPSYNDHKVIRRKQLEAIHNAHAEGLHISYISYTMMTLGEVDFIMNEICSNEWRSKNFRIRYGSDIGRNPGQVRIFVSDVYKAIEQWCKDNNKSFERIVEADNNIYHVMAKIDGKDIRIIQWCDETDIDMEELRSGPWCDFVPGGITNFLHQIIRRDAWKNKGNTLPDSPIERHMFTRNPTKDPLDLLTVYKKRSSMIKGINGQPYLDMEQHVDMETFEQLQPEIMRGFAEARWFAKEGTWMKPGFEFKDMSYTLNWKPIYAAMEEFQALSDDDPIKVEGMKIWPTDFKDYKQRNVITRYLKMAMEAYDPYIYYFLHEEGDWDARPEEKKETEESKFFPNTMKWLQGFKDNKIFESFGRVMFFHCEADGLPFEHRDLGAQNGIWTKDRYEDHNNEFIHIRTDTRNQFYIWDPDKKMKHGINTRAAFWNDQDWHGGNRVMCPTYGMRIDGTFTNAFREKLKLNGTY